MSAPRNDTPTPHRGTPVVWPYAPFQPVPDGYVGLHRFEEGRTAAQFRVAHLVKLHRVSKGVRA